jgi:hypothetical protein
VQVTSRHVCHDHIGTAHQDVPSSQRSLSAGICTALAAQNRATKRRVAQHRLTQHRVRQHTGHIPVQHRAAGCLFKSAASSCAARRGMVDAQCEQPQQQQHQQAATQGSRAQPAVPPAVVDAAGMYTLRSAGTRGGGGGGRVCTVGRSCGSQLSTTVTQRTTHAGRQRRHTQLSTTAT